MKPNSWITEGFEAFRTITAISGTTLTINSHGLDVGSILYDADNNEGRYVTAVIDANNVTINTAFTSPTITKVLVGQYDDIKSHKHTYQRLDTGSNWLQVYNHGGGGWCNETYPSFSTINTSNAGGTETRTTNLTYKIWVRVS